MRKLNYGFMDCARKMPPLRHNATQTFDITKSEVAKWLVSQPGIMQKVFDMAANHKVIRFNADMQCWEGADYDA